MGDTNERMSEERLADLHADCPLSKVTCMGSNTAWTHIERELIDALRAERREVTRLEAENAALKALAPSVFGRHSGCPFS